MPMCTIMMSKTNGDPDAALNALGPLGPYTVLQYGFGLINLWSIGMGMLSVVFTGQHNPFTCSNLTNDSSFLSDGDFSQPIVANVTYDDVCTVQNVKVSPKFANDSECNAFLVVYEYPKSQSFVSEFGLVCDRKYMIGLTQTVLTLGHAVAPFTFPYLADRFGRKSICLICGILSILTCIGLALSINSTMYITFKFFHGWFIQALESVAITIQIESLSTANRGRMMGPISGLNWSFSLLLLGFVAYVLREYSWRVIEGATGFWFLVVVLEFFYLTESLRWLAANGHAKRFHLTLKRAARLNKRKYDNVVCAFYGTSKGQQNNDPLVCDTNISTTVFSETATISNEIGIGIQRPVENKHKTERLTFWHLLTDPILRINTLFVLVAWFANSLTYFALILLSSALHGSLYINFTLNILAEIPSVFILYFFMEKIGRRALFSAFCVVAGLSLIAMATIRTTAPEQHVAITVFSILGKLGISGSYVLLYAFTPELFPTNLRNMGQGAAYIGARCGGMLAPFTELLMARVVYLPGLIFGVSCLVLSGLVFVIPETKGVQLAQTRQEMRHWKRPSMRIGKSVEEDAQNAASVTSHVYHKENNM